MTEFNFALERKKNQAA